MPAAQSVQVVELIKQLNDQHGPFPGAVGLRYVGPSSATLGFTRYAPTCVVELDGVDGDRIRRFFRRAWAELVAQGIDHTLHWGKVHELDAAAVRRSYGDTAVDAWLAARRQLLSPKAREVFASPLLETMGLA